MKLLKITFALLYLSFYHAIAQTNIGGTLRKDTAFTKAGSPYFITSNLGVSQGRTLTIEPGVIINFDNASQIIIQGKLVANGNKDEPIIFNGKIKSDAMLVFEKTNLNNSFVSFVRFNGPKDAIKINYFRLDNTIGILNLNNVEFFNTKFHNNGNIDVIINNSQILNTLLLTSLTARSINFNNCQIDTSQIIDTKAYFDSSFISNSTIKGSETRLKNSKISTSTIMGGNSQFENSKVSNSTISGGNSVINHSIFSNSFINLSTYNLSASNNSISFDSNYIQSVGITFGNGNISNTVLAGNGKMKGIERISATFNIRDTYPFQVNYCSFVGFETNIVLNGSEDNFTSGYYDNLFILNLPGQFSVSNCNLFDVPKNYFIQNLSTLNALAYSNWWSTTDISVIDSKIYDYWDDILYGEVIYKDNLQEPAVVGIKQTEVFKSTIKISPNPFNYETTIENSNSFNGWTMNLLDATGAEVRSSTNLNGNKIKLARENLKSGLYFLRLSNEKGNSTTSKIIITD
jgi:hypothetical protein